MVKNMNISQIDNTCFWITSDLSDDMDILCEVDSDTDISEAMDLCQMFFEKWHDKDNTSENLADYIHRRLARNIHHKLYTVSHKA